MVKALRYAIFPLIAAMSLTGAAKAQDGLIWVECEAVGGEAASAVSGVRQIGSGTYRVFNVASRSLSENLCAGGDSYAVGRCEFSPDEFTYEMRSDFYGRTDRVRIDRRTGRAFFTANTDQGGRILEGEAVCRGVTDPRPPAQF